MRNQPKLIDRRTKRRIRRDPLPSCVDPRVRTAVRMTSARFGVSRSWVIAEILADFFGFDYGSSFQEPGKEAKAKRR